jgi:hypothetical protein
MSKRTVFLCCLFWFITCVLLAVVEKALAGVTVVERAGIHELRKRDNSQFLCPEYRDPVTQQLSPAAMAIVCVRRTHADCVAAVPAPTAAGLTEYTCKQVTHVDVQATCSDVNRPANLPPEIDEDGHVYQGNLYGLLCPGRTDGRNSLHLTRWERRDEWYAQGCWREVTTELFSCNAPPEFIMPPPHVPPQGVDP